MAKGFKHGDTVKLRRELAARLPPGRGGRIIERKAADGAFSIHPGGDASKVFVLFEDDATARAVAVADLAKGRAR